MGAHPWYNHLYGSYSSDPLTTWYVATYMEWVLAQAPTGTYILSLPFIASSTLHHSFLHVHVGRIYGCCIEGQIFVVNTQLSVAMVLCFGHKMNTSIVHRPHSHPPYGSQRIFCLWDNQMWRSRVLPIIIHPIYWVANLNIVSYICTCTMNSSVDQ